MELRNYLHAERGRIVRLADSMGWPAAYLSQIAHGRRPMPVERATDLEMQTGRSVMRWDLFPTSWHRIWPELIGTPGAPAIPAEQETQHAA